MELTMIDNHSEINKLYILSHGSPDEENYTNSVSADTWNRA